MRFKIRAKFFYAFFGFLLFIFFVTGLVGLRNQRVLYNAVAAAAAKSEDVLRIDNLMLALDQALMPGNDWIITGDKKYFDDFQNASRETDLRLLQFISGAQAVEKKRIADEAATAWLNIQRLSLKIFAIPHPIGSEDAARLMEEMDYRWSYPLIERMKKLREAEAKEAARAAEGVYAAWKMSWVIMAAAAFALLASGLFLSRFLSRHFAAAIEKIHERADAIAHGEFKARLDIKTGDEIEQLSEAINEMAGEIELKTAELKKLAFALEQSINIVFLTDIKGNIEYVNPMFEQITGWSKEEAVGQNPRILASGETTKAEYEKLWNTILAGKTFRYTFKNKKKNGQYYWATAQIAPIKDERGEIVQFLAIQEDITEKKKAEDRAEYLAAYDELTGLYNRVRFMELMDKWIQAAQNPPTHPSDGFPAPFFKGGIKGFPPLSKGGFTAALLLIDIDEFKTINEIYGHNIGDQFLRHTAGLLKNSVEDVHRESVLAHLGGDEFAVFIPDINKNDALDVAEVMRKRIEGLYFTPFTTRFTASIGIALYPEHGAAVSELLSRADIAMYRAKASGRNRCHLYHPEDHDLEKIHSRIKEKERIQNALNQDHFLPWFQPILDLKDNKIHHCEALARMRGGDGAILLPGAFIDTAEIFGLVGAIDRVIIEKVIKLHAEIHRQGKEISFSINLSGKDLEDNELLAFLKSVILKQNVDPDHLIFEITETATVRDIDKAVKFINALKSIGCHFSLDDFGVGFTSFIYLREMGVDYIKIDGSFIKRLHEDNYDRLFVKAIVDVAKGMGIKTVAEFVENEEIIKVLKKIGVDYAQGYAIGKPAPWKEIESKI
ncbi:MAG: EAL domain-containing protein [Deltaproteobacteria bacterium]|nr:EAL domain-containing protein [Deltaproteobacteria bacterium]